MYKLYVLNEILTNNFNYNFLYLLSLISIICGILVIILNNPIVSVLYLIGLFISIASYLMMLGVNFIGLSYLLVYVGAVSILFLFILMLINIRISELVTNNSNSIPLAIMIGIFFNTIQVLPTLSPNRLLEVGDGANTIKIPGIKNVFLYGGSDFYHLTTTNTLSFVTSNSWDGRLAETSHITSIGNIIYTNYPIWLILTSLILLLAMIGSIIITIKQ